MKIVLTRFKTKLVVYNYFENVRKQPLSKRLELLLCVLWYVVILGKKSKDSVDVYSIEDIKDKLAD